jgi:hypothetical protein
VNQCQQKPLLACAHLSLPTNYFATKLLFFAQSKFLISLGQKKPSVKERDFFYSPSLKRSAQKKEEREKL